MCNDPPQGIRVLEGLQQHTHTTCKDALGGALAEHTRTHNKQFSATWLQAARIKNPPARAKYRHACTQLKAHSTRTDTEGPKRGDPKGGPGDQTGPTGTDGQAEGPGATRRGDEQGGGAGTSTKSAQQKL